MFSLTKGFLVSSALALGAAACGGGSTPQSDTPSAPPPEPAAESESPASTEPPTGTATSMAGEPGSASTTSETGRSAPSNTDASPSSVGTPAADLSDAQIAAITDGVNTAEIEQAKLAQNKSKNQQVRQFAAMMIEHHGQAKKQQAALKLSAADSPLSQQLSQESQSTLEALKAKKGDEFDRAYLQAQVEAHQKVLDTIERDLAPNAKNPELQTYLANLKPRVAQHLEQAQSARDALQTNNAKSSSR